MRIKNECLYVLAVYNKSCLQTVGTLYYIVRVVFLQREWSRTNSSRHRGPDQVAVVIGWKYNNIIYIYNETSKYRTLLVTNILPTTQMVRFVDIFWCVPTKKVFFFSKVSAIQRCPLKAVSLYFNISYIESKQFGQAQAYGVTISI